MKCGDDGWCFKLKFYRKIIKNRDKVDIDFLNYRQDQVLWESEYLFFVDWFFLFCVICCNWIDGKFVEGLVNNNGFKISMNNVQLVFGLVEDCIS